MEILGAGPVKKHPVVELKKSNKCMLEKVYDLKDNKMILRNLHVPLICQNYNLKANKCTFRKKYDPKAYSAEGGLIFDAAVQRCV